MISVSRSPGIREASWNLSIPSSISFFLATMTAMNTVASITTITIIVFHTAVMQPRQTLAHAQENRTQPFERYKPYTLNCLFHIAYDSDTGV